MASHGAGQSDIPHSGAMLMKHYLLVSFSLVLFVVFGCSSPASTNLDDYVGEYVLTPSSVVPGEFASFVILKADHTAVEIRFSKVTGEIAMMQKRWHLDRGTDEEVVIDSRAYPIQRTKSTIKLVINGDLGTYYTKVR
jgi:hypothetical protein